MKAYSFVLCAAGLLGLAACQNKDYDVIAPILSPIAAENISGQLVDNSYVWSWTANEGKSMEITILRNGQTVGSATSSTGSYTHENIETKVPYTYIFKVTDGKNFSRGVVKEYTRNGADPVSAIQMAQVEKENAGYDAHVEWTPSADATEVTFTATSGSRTITETLPASTTTYTISDVQDGDEWNVVIVASNADGKSLPASSSLKIGKTAVGFLSIYPTEEELIANGDDDEACAWLWLKSEYPAAAYIYFGDIASAETLDPYRVLFWMRDLEDRPENEGKRNAQKQVNSILN